MIFIALLQLAATGPSFDCARAHTDIERTICANAELGALDREEARIFGIARVVPQADRAVLLKRQRDFLRDRNSCPDAAAECIRDAYLGEIGDLRRMAALEDDDEGMSSGPNRFHCDGGYPDVYVTLFRTSPAQAWLSVPSANEGQPLAADPADGDRLVGRYATDMIYEVGAGRVRTGARICTP